MVPKNSMGNGLSLKNSDLALKVISRSSVGSLTLKLLSFFARFCAKSNFKRLYLGNGASKGPHRRLTFMDHLISFQLKKERIFYLVWYSSYAHLKMACQFALNSQ